MANADTVLKGSSSATNVTLRNDDTGSLTVLKDATQIFKVGASGEITSNSIKEDTNGNIGIGVTPNVTPSDGKSIQLGFAGTGVWARYENEIYLNCNTYRDGATSKYAENGYACRSYASAGGFGWETAPSGTAGNAITWTTAMTLDASGNFSVGYSGAVTSHVIAKAVTRNAGNVVLSVGYDNGTSYPTLYVQSISVTGWNSANCGMMLGRDGTTSRSLNAGGTINASGADYAEYERNNGLTITKGSIVGFKADGTLTLTFAEAVRFGIKSTNPSYVGGDTWGSEDVVGKRPEKTEEQTDEEFAPILAAWEAALEAERQKVDRIAYSGKVPVNVTGATAGGYIIAVDNNGQIDGEFVTDPDFAQYKKAVGRVNRILEDGRAEVAVIVH